MRLTSLILLLVAPAAAAVAQSSARAPVPRSEFIRTMDGEFGKMDADKDNVLTRSEIEQFQRAIAITQSAARNRALFAQLDADRNGQLSGSEFMKLQTDPPSPNAAPVLRQTDLNKDQSVTLVEYRTAKLVNFDSMDADKDGIVTVAEMKAAGLVK